jgi:outer membrane protein assembly factor BamB
MPTPTESPALKPRRMTTRGKVVFVFVAAITAVLTAISLYMLNADADPSQQAMGGMIFGAAAFVVPVAWFSWFSPFSRTTQFVGAAIAYAVAAVFLQTGEPAEAALANILTLAFGILCVSALGLGVLYFASGKVKVASILLTVLAIATFFTIFKLEDPTGNMVPRIRYRFTATRDRLLKQPNPSTSSAAIDLTTTPNDFPRFLGTDGDSVIKHPVTLDTDWSTHPPQPIWRKPIGAGWSAFAIVNGHAVTMEQRDTQELVTCYDLKSGELVWSHGIEGRHEDPLGGIGPRATPTVVDGKVYACGATGVLRCLDGATGKLLWSQDLRAERHLDAAMDLANVAWGRAASPLVVDDLVIIPAGGRSLSQLSDQEKKSLGLSMPTATNVPQVGDFVSLIAFNRHTGEQVWQGGTSQVSYASPQLVTLDGVRQIAILNQDNVAGHDIATGKQLWQFYWPGESNSGASNSQVHILPGDQVFVSKGYSQGCAVYQVKHHGDQWSVDAEPVWANRTVMKTKFTNVVIHNGFIYGLSDGVLECVDASDGRRKWKRGKYGHGQVLLVGKTLIVLGEAGQLALVAATPDAFNELASIQVLEGKTWNNPALSGDLLLVRNAEEAACYRLPVVEPANTPLSNLSR